MCVFVGDIQVSANAHKIQKIQIPWSWSYRWLKQLMWVLGIELESSERAVSALNY